MRGRKPTLKAIEGGARSSKATTAPSWFSDFARDEWERVTPDLNRRGVLTQETAATIENYCVCVGTIRECEIMLQREGRIASYASGPGLHPAAKLQSAAIKDARSLAIELGLTPRRKAGDETTADGDAWVGLLA